MVLTFSENALSECRGLIQAATNHWHYKHASKPWQLTGIIAILPFRFCLIGIFQYRSAFIPGLSEMSLHNSWTEERKSCLTLELVS